MMDLFNSIDPITLSCQGENTFSSLYQLTGLIIDLISVMREEILTRCHEASKYLRKFCYVYINFVSLRRAKPPPPFATLD
jgi:hypothetical protein